MSETKAGAGLSHMPLKQTLTVCIVLDSLYLYFVWKHWKLQKDSKKRRPIAIRHLKSHTSLTSEVKWSEVKCVYVVTQLDSAVPHQPTMTAHWCRGHHNHTGPWPSWHPWRAAVTAPWRAWPASGWMRRRRQGQRLRRMPVQTERRGTQGWGRRRQRSGVHWQH